MATIQEELVLVDRFSPTFPGIIRWQRWPAARPRWRPLQRPTTNRCLPDWIAGLYPSTHSGSRPTNSRGKWLMPGVQSRAAFDQLDARLDSLGATIRDLNNQYDMVEQQMREAQGSRRGRLLPRVNTMPRW